MIRFDKALLGLNEHALLGNYAIITLQWFNYAYGHIIWLLQENNPTIFARRLFASEVKSYTVISCEVYRVGFATVVLDYSKGFQLIRLTIEFTGSSQFFTLKGVEVFNAFCVVTAVKTR